MAKRKVTETKRSSLQKPDKYTTTEMISYLSEKHNLPKTQVKNIYNSVFDVIAKGVLDGKRVPLGKFGKIFIKLRAARKSRKGRNPITGNEITIPAKKAIKVPKFSFSKNFKDDAIKSRLK